MLSKDELNKLVGDVVAGTEQDAQRLSTEEFIATIKGYILDEVGKKIVMHALTTIASSEKEDVERVAKEQLKMKHTAFLIAEAAEKIMRRTWIG